MTEKDNNIFRFILRERFITLTVIGSIFTFAFIASLKADIIDPLLQFILTEENFGFMDITIREGEKMPPVQKQLELRFGNFFRESVTWIFVIIALYILYLKTSFPDQKYGNPGVAAM
jgi:large-conductance mechanosensitive channel